MGHPATRGNRAPNKEFGPKDFFEIASNKFVAQDQTFLQSTNIIYSHGFKAFQKEDNMELKQYFENTEGNGILSTADGSGQVDAAIYSRPHIMDAICLLKKVRVTRANAFF
jgi:hypothetical protein